MSLCAVSRDLVTPDSREDAKNAKLWNVGEICMYGVDEHPSFASSRLRLNSRESRQTVIAASAIWTRASVRGCE
jgi:hypothetical protein